MKGKELITKAKIQGRIRATGNGYAFFVPKALIDCNVLIGGKLYEIDIKEDSDSSLPEQCSLDSWKVGSFAEIST
jgi:hypothetical protein